MTEYIILLIILILFFKLWVLIGKKTDGLNKTKVHIDDTQSMSIKKDEVIEKINIISLQKNFESIINAMWDIFTKKNNIIFDEDNHTNFQIEKNVIINLQKKMELYENNKLNLVKMKTSQIKLKRNSEGVLKADFTSISVVKNNNKNYEELHKWKFYFNKKIYQSNFYDINIYDSNLWTIIYTNAF